MWDQWAKKQIYRVIDVWESNFMGLGLANKITVTKSQGYGSVEEKSQGVVSVGSKLILKSIGYIVLKIEETSGKTRERPEADGKLSEKSDPDELRLFKGLWIMRINI